MNSMDFPVNCLFTRANMALLQCLNFFVNYDPNGDIARPPLIQATMARVDVLSFASNLTSNLTLILPRLGQLLLIGPSVSSSRRREFKAERIASGSFSFRLLARPEKSTYNRLFCRVAIYLDLSAPRFD
jgi:hypothetical protein